MVLSELRAQLPTFRCHKVVQAAKIVDIRRHEGPASTGGGYAILHFEDPVATLRVESDFLLKHRPQVGGYFVVYDDGYLSWSPARAFEEGYTRV